MGMVQLSSVVLMRIVQLFVVVLIKMVQISGVYFFLYTLYSVGLVFTQEFRDYSFQFSKDGHHFLIIFFCLENLKKCHSILGIIKDRKMLEKITNDGYLIPSVFSSWMM